MAVRDITYLYHIMECIEKIEAFSADNARDDKTLSAIERQLEIIGEASNTISKDFRKEHNHIPWRDIIGTRNKLIHDYLGIRTQTIWEIVEMDLLELKTQIHTLIQQYEQ